MHTTITTRRLKHLVLLRKNQVVAVDYFLSTLCLFVSELAPRSRRQKINAPTTLNGFHRDLGISWHASHSHRSHRTRQINSHFVLYDEPDIQVNGYSLSLEVV